MERAVLIVEDKDRTMSALSHTLGKAGYSVFEARGGDESLMALNIARGLSLVLIGPGVPWTVRSVLIKAVRRHPEHRFAPILIMAPEYLMSDPNEWISAGANAWIEEPFTKEEFLRAVCLTAA